MNKPVVQFGENKHMHTHALPAQQNRPKYLFIKNWLYIVLSRGISRIAAWPSLLSHFYAISSAEKRKAYYHTRGSLTDQIHWIWDPGGYAYAQDILNILNKKN